MICSKCVEEGKKSTIHDAMGGTITTAMAGHSFYDEDGKYHHHNPNTRTSFYECSNGHEFTVSITGSDCCDAHKKEIEVFYKK